MKKTYKSPKTIFVQIKTSNVILTTSSLRFGASLSTASGAEVREQDTSWDIWGNQEDDE